MKQVNNTILFIIVLINAIVVSEGYTNDESLYWMLVITLPVLVLAIIKSCAGKTP